MPKGGNKGKSKAPGHGVGQSVFLVNVDEANKTASFSRMPFNQENDNGETLVRTSEDVIKLVTRAILAEYPKEVRDALTGLVKQNVRSAVRGAPAFETTKIPLTLPTGDDDPNPDDEDEDDSEDDEVEDESPLPTEPVTEPQRPY